MTRSKKETTTIQCWPGGQSFTYRGDIDGPANQRSLRDGYGDSRDGNPNPWRKGTDDEWRLIRIATRAEMYGRRDVLCCDSALVDDLINAAQSLAKSDLADGFGYDEIQNLYADPSDWDADRCRDYISEHCEDRTPTRPTVECEHCKGLGTIDEPARPHEDDSDMPRALPCPVCVGTQCLSGVPGEILDPEADEDDSPRGYLTELRDVCREHAQDNPAEVFEWWRVSSWLCGQLSKIGEVVIDNGYGHWWGRTCTGQGFLMDGTLQAVAASFEQEIETVYRAERLTLKLPKPE